MTDQAQKSAIVTGGAGFIGSHLVEELLKLQYSVTILDTLAVNRERNLARIGDRAEIRQFDLARDDLRLLLEERRFDTIFHLAGFANIPESVNFPAEDFEKNAVATFRLAEAVRNASPQTRILFTSSAAVYGEGRGEPLTEEDPTYPVAPYGVSKLTAEQYFRVYAERYGLRTASLRLFAVYGPRLRNHVIYDLIRKVHENPRELPIHGDGTQVRDFTFVTNVVDALLCVRNQGLLRGECYNVGSEEPVAISELARMICKEMSVDPKFTYGGDVRPGVALRWYADISRIKQLGYQPRVKLAEGLAKAVAWFQEDMLSSFSSRSVK